MTDQLRTIAENGQTDKIKPFLQSLSDKERRDLRPVIKELDKKYSKWVKTTLPNGHDSYHSLGSPQQFDIIKLAAFVCFDGKEFIKSQLSWGFLGREDLMELLEWNPVDWIGDYINSFDGKEFIHFNYEQVMQLKQLYHFEPAKELTARLLSSFIYSRNADHSYNYEPEKLEMFQETLQEHIWYLFEYESGINWSDRYMRFKDNPDKNDTGWNLIFKKYINEGKLNRKRVLQETLAATSRNLTKTLCGWFADLFSYLDPSFEEQLELQEDMLMALNSPQSKPVNTILSYFKKLSSDKAFRVDEFIQQAPLLFSKDVKSIHIATLSILDNLAKKHKDKQQDICLATAQSFMIQDETVQNKAAQLITKYGDHSSTELSEMLSPFIESMMTGPRSSLSDFLTTNPESDFLPDIEVPEEQEKLISQNHMIPLVDNPEDLLFLISQSLENNQPYHIELMAASLIRMHSFLQAELAQQMEPTLKQAYKTVMNPPNRAGELDSMAASFLIEYGRFLKKLFPDQLELIDRLHSKYKETDQEQVKKWTHYHIRICDVKNWKGNHLDNFYKPFRQILSLAIEKIKTGNSLPLLSTPTHEPCWIDPKILVNRLEEYQNANKEPDHLDWQIAISRIALENTEEALKLAQQSLQGKFLTAMNFLLDRNSQPVPTKNDWDILMTSALTKAPETISGTLQESPYKNINRSYLTGDFPWETSSEEYLAYGEYNSKTRGYNRYIDHQTVFRIICPESGNVSIKKGKFNDETEVKYTLTKKDPLLVEFFIPEGKKWFSVNINDIQRLIYTIPNHPDVFLALIMQSAMSHSGTDEVQEKETVLKTIETLYSLPVPLGKMGYLFIATCMLNANKTSRTFAAELWIDRVSKGSIDSRQIGHILGMHQRFEWAPMNRLTTLILNSMMRISQLHNRELEILLSECISLMPEKPVKELKKLLEIYYEILNLNQSFIKDHKINSLLNVWKQNANLKKIAVALENLEKTGKK